MHSLVNISSKILSDPVNRWIFSNSRECYIVGGFLRDLILGNNARDRDFVIRYGAGDLARRVASKFNGKLIEFQRHQTFRVVLRDHRYIDFSNLKGRIDDDLALRDFTINALAWSPDKGIIDPDNYLSDIRECILRVVKPDNLITDPLRILRAYRLAAQMNLLIHSRTRIYLKKYSQGLKHVSSERLTDEFFRLLSLNNATDYVKSAIKDNVIFCILGLTIDIIVIFNFLSKLDAIMITLSQNRRYEKIYDIMHHEFSQSLTRIGLLRLFLLSYSHFLKKTPDSSLTINPLHKSILLPSVKIKKSILNLQESLLFDYSRLSRKRMMSLLISAKGNEFEAAIIIMLIKRGSLKFIDWTVDYMRVYSQCLFNGKEIKDITGTQDGRVIGHIKRQLIERQFIGKLRSRREARNWIISNFT